MKPLLLIFPVFLLCASCDFGQATTTSEQQRLQLEQQKFDQENVTKCAAVADAAAQKYVYQTHHIFDEQPNLRIISTSNHYAKSLSKCFVNITTLSDSPSISDST